MPFLLEGRYMRAARSMIDTLCFPLRIVPVVNVKKKKLEKKIKILLLSYGLLKIQNSKFKIQN